LILCSFLRSMCGSGLLPPSFRLSFKLERPSRYRDVSVCPTFRLLLRYISRPHFFQGRAVSLSYSSLLLAFFFPFRPQSFCRSTAFPTPQKLCPPPLFVLFLKDLGRDASSPRSPSVSLRLLLLCDLRTFLTTREESCPLTFLLITRFFFFYPINPPGIQFPPLG